MAYLKLANRAVSLLASDITDSDLSLSVTSGEGALFPSTGDFHVTICSYSAGVESNIEIVNVTARSADTFTIVRAQESTDAAAHVAGERVQLRITAGVLTNIEDNIITKATLTAKGDIISASAASTPEVLGVGTDTYLLKADSGEASGLNWVDPASLSVATHKDSHDPNDGSDALDTANAASISGVQAAGTGTSHSLARADHVHGIAHSIADNALVTVDGTSNSPVNTDYAKWTANGLEGVEKSQILSDLNVADGADVTADNTCDTPGGAGTDTTAIHDDTAAEISAVDLKATPVANDEIIIEDSAATYAKKSVTLGSLPVSTATSSEIDSDVSTHAALDTGVHGAGGDTLATDADISTHAGLDTGVHGAGGDTLATDADITTHAAVTTSVHNFDASGNAPPQAHASNHTDGTDDVADLVGDSGAGGTHGLVPAPGAGDAAAGKYLKADGVWTTPAGGGDVTGPASSTDNMIARHDSTTGKVLQNYTSNPPTISDTGDVTVDGDLSADNTVVGTYKVFDDGGETITGDGTDMTINSGNDINLTATADINIPANVGLEFAGTEKIESDGTDLSITVGANGDVNIPANIGVTFGDDGEKIEGDGTDLTITGNNINLTATADVIVPANVGVTFGTGEKIEGDDTDLTLTSGGDIALTATNDINIPANVGLEFAGAEKIESDGTDLNITVGAGGDINVGADIGITFGDDGEKIEGDGTDLTISGNNINLTATADVVVPANVGVTFGTGEKIEGDNTDLTVTSGGDISLTATNDVNVPANVGVTFGDDGEKIEGDGTNLTITSSGTLSLNSTGAITASNQGIADNAVLTVDQADAADDEFARFTANGIESLSVAEAIAALLGSALPENTAIILDSSLSADGKYSGIVQAGTAGATLIFGDCVYQATADDRWEKALADAESTTKGRLGICVLAAAGDGSATTILLWGTVRADTAFPSFTTYAPVFIDASTAGDLTNTAPTGSGNQIRCVGQAISANELEFHPSPDWFEHA